MSNLFAPKKPNELKFKDICDTLKKHFSPQPIKIAERYRFYNRKQAKGESAADYLANFGNWQACVSLKHFLIMPSVTLVCGVREPGIQYRLLAEVDLTLKKHFS